MTYDTALNSNYISIIDIYIYISPHDIPIIPVLYPILWSKLWLP